MHDLQNQIGNNYTLDESSKSKPVSNYIKVMDTENPLLKDNNSFSVSSQVEKFIQEEFAKLKS